MATGKERQKRLAREHYERQLERRAKREAKKKRVAVIGSTIGIVAVVGGVVAAVALLGGNDGETGAAADTSAPPTPSAPPVPTPTPIDLATLECSYQEDAQGPAKKVGTPPAKPNLKTKTMTLKTNEGDIVIDMATEQAPCTVGSFAFLAKKDYFDGTKCHRLVTPQTGGLAILQCGDPLAKADGKGETDGQGGPGYTFDDENLGGMEYGRGTVAMANSGPNTNGSQFFLIYGDETKALPPQYTPFGTVREGLEILDKVAEGGHLADNTAPKVGIELKDVTISGKS